MFVVKRVIPDIHQTVAVLSTRIKNPNNTGWKKLVRMIKYYNVTNKNYFTLSSDGLKVIQWYVDAIFAFHPGFKSHTVAIMTMGQEEMQSVSRKQKLKKMSITEAGLVDVDDASVKFVWTVLFIELQG